ncbi:MAG: hypothetical protein HY553_10740 [Elusimicrobia bacterium]|nr:hypothetical protein [Elusimicrobiota bacterium]
MPPRGPDRAAIPGIEVTTYRNDFFGLPPSTSVRIRKTGERVRIPSLALAGVDDSNNPPLRVFEER